MSEIFRRLRHEEYAEHRKRHKLFWVKLETTHCLEAVTKYDQDLYYESWLYPSRSNHYLYEELEKYRITDKQYAEMVQKAAEKDKPIPISEVLEKAKEERNYLVKMVMQQCRNIVFLEKQDCPYEDVLDNLIDFIIKEVGYGK